MKAIFFSTLVLSASVFFGSVQAADPTPASAKSSLSQVSPSGSYVSKDNLFSIDIPKGWAAENSIQGVDAMFLAPPTDKTNGSVANLNVISGELEPGMDLNTFFTLNMNGLPKELSGFSQETTGNDTINGLDTKWVRYTHKVGDLEIRVQQYFFVVKNKGYVVTFSAIGKSFDDYTPAFKDAIKSFKITKN